MSIAILVPDRDTSLLEKTLQAELSNVSIFNYPNIPNSEEIDVLVVWKQPENVLSKFPNLKLISSLGAGIDHILTDKSLPENVPIVRITDEKLTISMRKYILMCILNFQKDIWGIFDFNDKQIWENNHIVEQSLKVGIMGLGALGKDVAISLHKIGFQVFGYSFSEKEIHGIRCFSKAKNEFDDFLRSVNVLVNLLPLTAETKGILNWNLFEKLPDNSFLVNVGRGAHLIDVDLIKAIQEKKIKGAFLDVFNVEPLPKNHPFWAHSEVIITPHIASITNQKNAGIQIAENYRKLKKGEKLINQIDLGKGY